MRITRIERGTYLGHNQDGTYTQVYTQPISRVVIAWFYDRIWVKFTWRFYRWLWKITPHKPDWKTFSDGKEYDVAMPFINRQDERAFDLDHAGRIEISMTYDPPKPKILGWSCAHLAVTGASLVGRPTSTGCQCEMQPIYATSPA